MGTVNDLYEAVAKIRLREELPRLVQATSEKINILVRAQLAIGQLSTGGIIRPDYASLYYANMKQAIGSQAPLRTPDIKLSGAYYAKMKTTVEGRIYNTESAVSYANSKSILQYGPQLLNMSEESKDIYCEEDLGPAIQTYITEKTGLTFI